MDEHVLVEMYRLANRTYTEALETIDLWSEAWAGDEKRDGYAQLYSDNLVEAAYTLIAGEKMVEHVLSIAGDVPRCPDCMMLIPSEHWRETKCYVCAAIVADEPVAEEATEKETEETTEGEPSPVAVA